MEFHDILATSHSTIFSTIYKGGGYYPLILWYMVVRFLKKLSSNFFGMLFQKVNSISTYSAENAVSKGKLDIYLFPQMLSRKVNSISASQPILGEKTRSGTRKCFSISDGLFQVWWDPDSVRLVEPEGWLGQLWLPTRPIPGLDPSHIELKVRSLVMTTTCTGVLI